MERGITRRAVLRSLTAAIAVSGTVGACRAPEPPPAAPDDQAASVSTTSVATLPTSDTTPSPANPAPSAPSVPSPPPSPTEPVTPTREPTPPTTSESTAPPAKDLQATSPSAAPTCGRMPGQKIEKVPWRFGSGNAECDRLETLWANVPRPDLACKSDSDCTIVSTDGNCINLPLSKKAAAKKEYQKAPCGNPASGACAGGKRVARCEAGCCGVG